MPLAHRTFLNLVQMSDPRSCLLRRSTVSFCNRYDVQRDSNIGSRAGALVPRLRVACADTPRKSNREMTSPAPRAIPDLLLPKVATLHRVPVPRVGASVRRFSPPSTSRGRLNYVFIVGVDFSRDSLRFTRSFCFFLVPKTLFRCAPCVLLFRPSFAVF